MTTKHTPGPWHNFGRQRNVAGLPHSAVGAKTLLARVYSEAYGDDAQETANARLIAAAPDLLEALRWIVLRTEEGGYPDGRCLEEARAAIARATGEQL